MGRIRLGARQNQIISQPSVITTGVYQVLAITLGGLGLGGLAFAMYIAPQPSTWGLVTIGLGLPIVLLLWHRPEFGLVVLIFLTGSFVSVADIVDLRLPIGGGMDLRDLALLGLFGVVFLRELSRGTLKVPWWPVGGPLLLFLIVAVFSTLYALIIEHGEPNWTFGDLRILSLYTTFYITLWSIKRPEQLKIMLAGLFMIADLTTVIMYLQQFLGVGSPLLKAMMVTRDWAIYQQAGVIRVVPAGQVLMHFMWFVALGLLLFARPSWHLRAFYVVQLLYIGGGHLLSYTRGEWVALLIGVGLVFIILAPRSKQNLAKATVIACTILLLTSVIVVSAPLLQMSTATPFVAGITQRFGSLLTPSQTEGTESLRWRAFETEKALQAIQKQPLTGVGLGNRYRTLSTFSSEASGSITSGNIATDRVSRFTRYVHNSYVSIAVKMGIPGLIILLWFCAAVLFRGFQVYRDMPDSEYKGVVLGILVGFAGLLVWCYFHAHLIKAESTATIGLMVALIGSIAYIDVERHHNSIWDRSLPVKE